MLTMRWRVVFSATLLAVWLASSAPRAEAGRVACDVVISAVHRQVGILRGRSADLSLVAKRLGTTVPWIEHCMRAYGRRPKRPGLESAEAREEQLESFEDEEPEEAFHEDVEEPGARERVVHPQKERVLRAKPPPTPEPESED